MLTVALAGFVQSWLIPSTAYACSVGSDFNPVDEVDIIVAGHMTSWRLAPEYAGPSSYLPVVVTMRVERVFKGVPAATIEIVDRASLNAHGPGAGATWSGSGGSCGAFNADPTGSYALLGLSREEDGRYRSSLPRTFFIGAGPGEAGYQEALKRLAGYGLIIPPTTGSAGLVAAAAQ